MKKLFSKIKYSKPEKKIISSAVSFIIPLIMLIILITQSFSWLATNKSSLPKDIFLRAGSYDLDVSLNKDNESDWYVFNDNLIDLNFTDIFCGYANKRTLEIEMTNTGDDTLYVSWFLFAPTVGEEVPYYDETTNLYHYLGSQLKIYEIKINNRSDAEEIIGSGEYLVTTSSDGEGQVTGVVSAPSNIRQIDIIENLTIEPDNTVTIEIHFVFADNGKNQNIYQGFYEEGVFVPFTGVCTRRLGFLVSY